MTNVISSMANNLAATMFRRRMRGSFRLWRFLAKTIFIDGCIRVKNKYGVELALDPLDDIDLFVIREGFYESEVFDAIYEAAKDGGVFWDIGANSGLHSITLSKLAPTARVISFEPSPPEIHRIVRSSLLSGAAIEILPFAVSDELKCEKFHLCMTNSGRNSLQMKGDTRSYRPTLASCITGDHLCFELGYAIPNVIKIDVEGAEAKVLNGMRRVMSNDKCRRIIVEAKNDLIESGDSIMQLLDGCGFSVKMLKRNEKALHVLENYCADKI